MIRRKLSRGFSLVEILLVLAVIGIISGIAIPSFLGQRRRARIIGDAQSNARVLQMMLENRKAENGLYGPSNRNYEWENGLPKTPEAATFLPAFTPKGNSKMNFKITIGETSLTYNIFVTDPLLKNAQVYKVDQSGSEEKLY